MKRSFLIKQLQSLKSQVESLLEAEGAQSYPNDIYLAIRIAKDLGAKEDVKAMTSAAKDMYKNAGFVEKIKLNYKSIMAFIKFYFDKAVEYLKNTSVGKTIIKYYDKAKKKLNEIWTALKGSDTVKWISSNKWHKALFLLGILLLIALLSYAILKDPKKSWTDVANSIVKSIKDSGSKIKELVSSIDVSLSGLNKLLKAVFEIIAAPFKALYAFVKSTMETGVGYVFGLTFAIFAASAGMLYWSVTKKKPEEVKA